MNVILEAAAGPAAGSRVRLLSGQVANIGRTEWADFSFPRDREMSDVHFQLECLPQGCRLRDLNTPRGTLVNGQKIKEVVVRHGDRIIAGQTTFLVHIEGAPTVTHPQGAPPAAPAPVPAALGTAGEPAGLTAPQLLHGLELSADAQPLCDDQTSPEEFLKRLEERQLFSDAVRFLARWLSKRQAVWWAALAVQNACGGALTGQQITAIEAAKRWAIDPRQDNARAAEAAAQALKLVGPASWVAMAAFWSGESLGPPGIDPIPPDVTLTAKAASTALVLAAYEDSAKAAERFRAFIKLGREMAQGKQPIPTP
jgi:hypothetical protein